MVVNKKKVLLSIKTPLVELNIKDKFRYICTMIGIFCDYDTIWLIGCCLKSSGKYFMHIQDENKLSHNKKAVKQGVKPGYLIATGCQIVTFRVGAANLA